jgi:hypothetical protein
MKTTLYTFALMLGLCGAGAVHACGSCVEDKVAAVYDYSVISQARIQKHHVAFFAIDGPLVNNEAQKRSIEETLKALDGVDKNSVHVSLDLAALSFSFDPRRSSFASAQKAIEKKLAPKGLSLMELKFIDESTTKIAEHK